jgi:RHS repeat-associated protein
MGIKKIKSITTTFSVAALLLLSLSGASNAADNVVYYHNDALGSPVAATDQSGNIIWKEEYKPFGERIIDDPKSEINSNWFTGKAEEEGFGIQYFGARWYHQESARFMSMDPVGVAESVEANPMMFNRYAYANNNPYRFVDPDGRWSTEAHNYFIKEAFPSLTGNQRRSVQRGSKYADRLAN